MNSPIKTVSSGEPASPLSRKLATCKNLTQWSSQLIIAFYCVSKAIILALTPDSTVFKRRRWFRMGLDWYVSSMQAVVATYMCYWEFQTLMSRQVLRRWNFRSYQLHVSMAWDFQKSAMYILLMSLMNMIYINRNQHSRTIVGSHVAGLYECSSSHPKSGSLS